MAKAKEKKRKTKTSHKKEAKAKWMWVEQLYLELDEIKRRMDKVEKTIRLIKKKLNIK